MRYIVEAADNSSIPASKRASGDARRMLSISIARGAEAHALLTSSSFLKEWRALQESCCWATLFQAPDFVAAWYDLYLQHYEPVIVQGHSSEGELVGLLALACPNDSQDLVVAGTPQSEYQVWLALPAWSEAFLEGALEQLRGTTFRGSLTFAYLPPNAPLEQLRANTNLAACCRIEALPQPLILLDEASRDAIHQFWRNKTVRNQLNRLKRLGSVCLERLTEPAQLEPVFDEIIAHYDCRIGALLGYSPFRNDPIKKRFLQRLLAIPDLLDIWILRAGDTIVGASLGFRQKDSVSLGVFAYSPFLAKCSPGKLLLMMLAERLAEEGFTKLDLTPDGDWKERLATSQATVHTLTMYFRRSENLKSWLSDRVKGSVKQLLRKIGINPQRLATVYHRAKAMRPRHLARALSLQAARLYRAPGLQIYSLKPASLADRYDESHIAVDRLEHLLAEVDGAGRQQTKDYLASALKRLEAGCRVHTCVREGKLVWSCWSLTGNGQTALPVVQPGFVPPGRSAALFGFYTASGAGVAVDRACLLEVLHDLTDADGLDTVYFLIDAHDRPTRHVVESIGAVFERTHQQAPASSPQVGEGVPER